ncbi:hypothetical protein QVD17_25142 [Tagetes erecta]|uniref:Uncharacterized protein n=1 Tax=Tagetes erecta TaxID=13708 RepID=A0AAD8NV57_TARER|nr:hypothetical protein QVD17_25142 [Tagetes erecta]
MSEFEPVLPGNTSHMSNRSDDVREGIVARARSTHRQVHEDDGDELNKIIKELIDELVGSEDDVRDELVHMFKDSLWLFRSLKPHELVAFSSLFPETLIVSSCELTKRLNRHL